MAGTLEGQDKGKMNDYVVIDGIHVAWVTPPSTLEAMKTFEVREDDIFIVTYPKSGMLKIMCRFSMVSLKERTIHIHFEYQK